MANYPQELAQDAVCQSHTGHMTGLWFLPSPAFKAEYKWMNEYIIKTLCWYVCLSLVFIISDCNLSTHLQRASEVLDLTCLFIYLFISLCLHIMTSHDFTWLDNPVWQCTCNKTVISQHPGSHFLIISSVLCKDGNDSYEHLVHWGESGSRCLDA